MNMIKWKKKNGIELTTNDMPGTIEAATRLGWVRMDEKSAAVDSAGMPWDERINTANRAKDSGGLWKRKQGLPPELVSQVENELLQNAINGK